MPIERSSIVVHNKTTADIRPFHEEFCRAADTHTLPEELADLFSIHVETRDTGKTWVTVTFAE